MPRSTDSSRSPDFDGGPDDAYVDIAPTPLKALKRRSWPVWWDGRWALALILFLLLASLCTTALFGGTCGTRADTWPNGHAFSSDAPSGFVDGAPPPSRSTPLSVVRTYFGGGDAIGDIADASSTPPALTAATTLPRGLRANATASSGASAFASWFCDMRSGDLPAPGDATPAIFNSDGYATRLVQTSSTAIPLPSPVPYSAGRDDFALMDLEE